MHVQASLGVRLVITTKTGVGPIQQSVLLPLLLCSLLITVRIDDRAQQRFQIDE